MSAAAVLGSALSAAGDPAATMRAEVVALVATIPALVLLLPEFGGLGAAAISLAAYMLRLVLQLRSASRNFNLPWSAFVIPCAADLRWLRARLGVPISS